MWNHGNSTWLVYNFILIHLTFPFVFFSACLPFYACPLTGICVACIDWLTEITTASDILNSRLLDYEEDWPSTCVGRKWAPGSLPAVRVVRQSQRAHAGFTGLNSCLQDDRAAEDTALCNHIEPRAASACEVVCKVNTRYLSDWEDDRVWILFSSCLQRTQIARAKPWDKRFLSWSGERVTGGAGRLYGDVCRIWLVLNTIVSKAMYGTGEATWWQYSTLESNDNFIFLFFKLFF